MGFFATLQTAFSANRQNGNLKQQDILKIRDASSRCSIIKMTALIGVISSIAFALFAVIAFDLLGMTFALIGAGLIGILCYDAFVVAGRMQKVFNSVETGQQLEYQSCHNRYTRLSYVTEGTLLARPIGQLALRNSPV